MSASLVALVWVEVPSADMVVTVTSTARSRTAASLLLIGADR